MGVIKVTKAPPRETTLEAQRNGLLYEILGRQYTVEYTVFVSQSRDDGLTIYNSPLVPKIGDQYNFGNGPDTLATLVRMRIVSTDSRLVHKLYCTYDTDRLVNAVTDNPLNQPPVIDWTTEQFEKPMVRDIFGTPYMSSSANFYDPVKLIDYKRSVLRITRNEAAFDEQVAQLYFNMLNRFDFAGYPPGCARINSITGQSQVNLGVYYYQVVYEISLRYESFAEFPQDQDYRDINGNLFLDQRTGAPLSNMTLLNGRGRSIWPDKHQNWDGAVSTIKDDILAADTFFDLAVPGHCVRFPPKQFDVDPVLNIRKGPHNEFSIIVGQKGRRELVGGVNWKPGVGINDNPVQQVTEPEIMLVTNLDPDLGRFFVERGQEGTTARDWDAGTDIQMLPYFRRFWPHSTVDFADLNLPII